MSWYAGRDHESAASFSGRLLKLIAITSSWSIAVTLGLFDVGVPRAWASPSRPHLSTSRYVENTSTSHQYDNGCTNANADDANGNTLRLDILDFGQQTSSGTYDFAGDNITTATIRADVENYALGFYECSDSTRHLVLAAGTNNYGGTASNAHGVTWGNMIDAIAASEDGQAVSTQVTFWGGSDIETFDSGQNHSYDAEAWAQGFNGATDHLYVNFGSADGCNQNGYEDNGGHGYTCNAANNSSFTQYSYWYLSWGNTAAESAPEIYLNGQQQQWTQICRFGHYIESSDISFRGPLTEMGYGGTYSSDQSWSAMWNSLDGTVCGQTPSYEVGQYPL